MIRKMTLVVGAAFLTAVLGSTALAQPVILRVDHPGRDQRTGVQATAPDPTWAGACDPKVTSDRQIRDAEKPPSPLRTADQKSWKTKEKAVAVARAQRVVGLPGGAAPRAELVEVKGDQTPFLADHMNGRAVWKVTVPKWTLKFESHFKDSYQRTLDVVLDAASGQVLRVETRWPENEPRDFVPLDARSAASEMLRFGGEKYHGLPEVAPPITFLQALDAIDAGGGNPLAAKQIEGLWVLWSRMDQEPKAMWVITLRGIPPVPIPGQPTPSTIPNIYRTLRPRSSFFQDFLRALRAFEGACAAKRHPPAQPAAGQEATRHAPTSLL